MPANTPLIHREPRIDAYIAKAAPFARPILAHLRDVVHAACPDVEESMKWSSPFFVYRGGNLCHMAAFKQHCAFGFWRSKEIAGLAVVEAEGAGNFGRIESIDDLPPKRELARFIRAAMKLNEAGAPVRPRKVASAGPVGMPADFAAALATSDAARAAFDDFPPGARREYVGWIEEAKRAETRATRIATAIEWISEGKRRNWKYEC